LISPISNPRDSNGFGLSVGEEEGEEELESTTTGCPSLITVLFLRDVFEVVDEKEEEEEEGEEDESE
jgi:hypothetical protein